MLGNVNTCLLLPTAASTMAGPVLLAAQERLSYTPSMRPGPRETTSVCMGLWQCTCSRGCCCSCCACRCSRPTEVEVALGRYDAARAVRKCPACTQHPHHQCLALLEIALPCRSGFPSRRFVRPRCPADLMRNPDDVPHSEMHMDVREPLQTRLKPSQELYQIQDKALPNQLPLEAQ